MPNLAEMRLDKLVGLREVIVQITWFSYDQEAGREDAREHIAKNIVRVTTKHVRVLFDEVELQTGGYRMGLVALERKEYCVRKAGRSRR